MRVPIERSWRTFLAITLFVDTNVFLSLFAFSDDDINQFRSLFVLSQEGEIDFLLPKQVIDEFWRNRESKIHESVEVLKKIGKITVPAMARELPEAAKFMAAQKTLAAEHKALVDELMRKAKKNQLSADHLIKEIFEKSTVIEVTQEIIEKAKMRMLLGNPPGKNGSYGDAVNWECILTKIDILDTLCFVSRDKDYSSKLHDGVFNEFLKNELQNEHIATVSYFSSLKAFMENRFPKVKIEAFMEASGAVQALENSGNFASTHGAVVQLLKCESFSTNQLKRIIVAAEENHQVNWILGDSDLVALFKKLDNEYSEFLFESWQNRLKNLIIGEGDTETSLKEDFDELPF